MTTTDLITELTDEEKIAAAWAAVGVKSVRPLRRMIFVHTERRPERIGQIWLPPDKTSNHASLPHKVMLYGLVMAAGPKAKVLKPGMRIGFSRLFFAWWKQMEDKTLIGWIDEENVYLMAEQESDVSLRDASPYTPGYQGLTFGL